MKTVRSDDQERHKAEDIWLNYLNQYLYESGTISQREYKAMTEKIAKRKHIPSSKKCRVPQT